MHYAKGFLPADSGICAKTLETFLDFACSVLQKLNNAGFKTLPLLRDYACETCIKRKPMNCADFTLSGC